MTHPMTHPNSTRGPWPKSDNRCLVAKLVGGRNTNFSTVDRPLAYEYHNPGVGRGEHGERTGARQRLNEAGSLDLPTRGMRWAVKFL